ncbi:Uncharacterised protein [Mycobacteroides abscessus subsp. massiliense]|nr:Uncharacterised protein [Mycobacteroides abscessus subsp. massiliense]
MCIEMFEDFIANISTYIFKVDIYTVRHRFF